MESGEEPSYRMKEADHGEEQQEVAVGKLPVVGKLLVVGTLLLLEA